MKRTKPKIPKKRVRNKHATYSSVRKGKTKGDFEHANGTHTIGENQFLHENATPYHTRFDSLLDVVTPPAPEIEVSISDDASPIETSEELAHIERLNSDAETRWADKLCIDNSLTRALVSFQANKGRAVYRWFKYKEAFSAGLIEHLLSKYRIMKGIMLDPFAGSGTALFVAGGHGMKTEGIELLPIGRTLIATKQLIDWDLTELDVKRLAFWRDEHPWRKCKTVKPINELRITRGAYPAETFDAMGRFLEASEQEGGRVKAVLLFALLCILEDVSFTRKDGQYLRWDHRSGRRSGKKDF